MRKYTIGIDATNLRRGGGQTHLIEILKAAEPEKIGIDRVILWAAKETLDLIENRNWLIKRSPSALNAGLLRRLLWQYFSLSREARLNKCDVLFVPGGSYAGKFHPIVTMSRNMLPFEWRELLRHGLTMVTLRLLLLRFMQIRTFRRADGLVFLTQYARNTVQSVTGKLDGSVTVISHGINSRFSQLPRAALSIKKYSETRPFRILYVSIINQYKHQWRIVEAVWRIRERSQWPLILDLVGPSYSPAFRRFNKAREDCDPDCAWVKYHGVIRYDQLHMIYQQADLGLFASSCENMPNILLEKMAAGLPIACSERGPMPEVLGVAGVYFDPLDTESIEQALVSLIQSPALREELADASYKRAQEYRWDHCADQTFAFLVDIAAKTSGAVLRH